MIHDTAAEAEKKISSRPGKEYTSSVTLGGKHNYRCDSFQKS